MAKSEMLTETFGPEPKSYNQAISDVVAALAAIAANVTGPMQENVWLQVVRMEVEKLRMAE